MKRSKPMNRGGGFKRKAPKLEFADSGRGGKSPHTIVLDEIPALTARGRRILAGTEPRIKIDIDGVNLCGAADVLIEKRRAALLLTGAEPRIETSLPRVDIAAHEFGAPGRMPPRPVFAGVGETIEHKPPRLVPTAAGRARMASLLQAEPPRPVPKPETFRSEAWLRAVRSIPCVHCGGQVQAAHRNEGKGTGQKVDDCLTAALCPPEHARIDQGKDLSRDERRALLDRYIVLTLLALVREGKVGVVAS